jgi:hypothetical protein
MPRAQAAFADEFQLLLCLPICRSKLSGLDQPIDCFEAYDVRVEETKIANERLHDRPLLGRTTKDVTRMTKKLMRALRKAPQPPLSYPGAAPDSDRAMKPPLCLSRGSSESRRHQRAANKKKD